MFTNHSPRLRIHCRSLERQRLTLERFLDSLHRDEDLARTHADTLAQLDIIDQEISELSHLLFLATVEKLLLWALPTLAATVSILLATLG